MIDTEVGTYQGRTAQQWREAAYGNRKDAAESWERSDTDGFVSQWASGITASECEAKAELAEANGWAEFIAVFDLDGNLMDAYHMSGTYGPYWLIKGLPKDVKPFFSESNARKGSTRYANDTKKGYRLGTVRRKGFVKLAGSGTGLAGAMSVRVVVVPDKYSTEVEIVDSGTVGNEWYREDH